MLVFLTGVIGVEYQYALCVCMCVRAEYQYMLQVANAAGFVDTDWIV